MPAAVLDTSVLVRYLTEDSREKAAAARTYLQAADKDSLLFPHVAMAELAFVLLRVYRWPASSAADAIRAVVSNRAIVVPDTQIWLQIADDLEQGYGPVDAYLLRTAERSGVGAVVTFDENMRELPSVRRVTPQEVT
jgi:predicted nucleic acid-binding protein